MAVRKRTQRNDESELSRAVRLALTAKGAWVIRIQSGTIPVGQGTAKRFIHCGEPGCPDLLVMYSGRDCVARFCWLEVKTKTGKLSATQSAWHMRAATRGVRVHVVRGLNEAMGAVFGSEVRA